MKKTFLITALFISASLSAQQNVEQVNATDNIQNSIVYYLPKTSLKIEVEVKKTIQKAGPYASHAKDCFGLEDNDIIYKDNVIYEISEIKVSNKGIPDFFRMYKVTAPLKSNANLVLLNESGIIQGVNVSEEELPARSGRNNIATLVPSNINPVITFDKSDLPEEYFSATSYDEQISTAVEQIHALRETGFDMLSGYTDNIPSDAPTFQLMLDELKRKEANIMALFKGKSVTVTEYKTFEIIPEKSALNKVLFYFSDSDGVTKEESKKSSPVYITFVPSQNTAALPETGTQKPNAKNGFFYCIPQYVGARIYNNEKIFFEESMPIAQFGTVGSLPVNFVEKNNAAIIFDITTGTIQVQNK